MPRPKFVCVDIETISLDPEWRHIWEVAVVTDEGVECLWQLDVPLEEADPKSLELNRFNERRWEQDRWSSHVEVAEALVNLANGAYWVGAVPSFDEERLRGLVTVHGFKPSWRHRLRCVETLTTGWFGEEVGGLAACCERFGIANPEHHSALADARAARDIYERIVQ